MSDITPPCDCIENVNGVWIADCSCSNRGDGEGAAAWAAQENCQNEITALRAENERLRAALQEVKPLVLGANHSEARHPKALAVLCQDEDGCVSNSPEKPDGSRVVHELISQDWDRGPYNVVAELKSLLTSVVDHGASIDSGTTAAAAYLYAQIGGVEYRITVVENRRINETGSNNG